MVFSVISLRARGLLAAAVILVLGLAWTTSGAVAQQFSITATKRFVWNGSRAVAQYAVKGEARTETDPWIPCEGFDSAGYELRWGWERSGEGGQIAWAELHDPTGARPDFRCPRPPIITLYGSGDDRAALPADLALVFSNGGNCMAHPNGHRARSFGAGTTVTDTPASPGQPAVEQVSISKHLEEPIWPDWLASHYTTFCLAEHGGYEEPNPECAEFFAPELCATEYFPGLEALQRFRVRYVKTVTRACPAARRSRNSLRKQLRGRHLPSLRRYYLAVAVPRFIGNCK
jgi:hypothetical protein